LLVIGDLRASGDAAPEGDGEGIEGGLPAFLADAVRIQGSDDEVEAFERGLLVGEATACPGRPPEPGVQLLDRVRRVNHPANLG
jgi:hypothetical protein